MTLAVKRFTSLMAGHPVLSGTVGTLKSLLQACLVDGFNPLTLTGLTQTGGVATATYGSAHGYAINDVLLIGGATPAGYNGEVRVLSVTATTLTFAADAGLTSPATGTITSKIAPLNWTMPYSGANKAAFRPASPYAQCLLRVQDDSSTPTSASGRWGKWRGYETMTDVDTGTGLFPTVAQAANGLSVFKSSTSDSVERHWWLVGDPGLFYFGTFWHASYLTYAGAVAFGDCNSLRSGDAYSSLIIAEPIDSLSGAPWSNNAFSTLVGFNTTQTGHYLARSYSQTGSAVAAGKIGDNGVSLTMGYGGPAYPHPPDNGLLFAPVGLTESNAIRSRALPGLYQPLHTAPLAYLDTLTGLADLPGRTLQAFDLVTSSARAQCLIDITGPWR